MQNSEEGFRLLLNHVQRDGINLLERSDIKGVPGPDFCVSCPAVGHSPFQGCPKAGPSLRGVGPMGRRLDPDLSSPVWLLKRVMTKEKLIEIIQGVLKSDCDLDFLLQLEKSRLETPAARIRTGLRML